MIPLSEKVAQILYDRGISINRFCLKTGINRGFFYQRKRCKHRRWIVEETAKYLDIPARELVGGTHMETK